MNALEKADIQQAIIKLQQTIADMTRPEEQPLRQQILQAMVDLQTKLAKERIGK